MSAMNSKRTKQWTPTYDCEYCVATTCSDTCFIACCVGDSVKSTARSKNKDKVVKVSLWQSLTRPKKLKKEGNLLVNHGAASAETVLDFPKLWGSQMLTL